MPPLMRLFYKQYQGNNASALQAHIIHCYETRFDRWATQAQQHFFKNPVEALKGSKIPVPQCNVPIETINSVNGAVTRANLEDIVLNLDDPMNPFNSKNDGTQYKVVDPQQPSQSPPF